MSAGKYKPCPDCGLLLGVRRANHDCDPHKRIELAVAKERKACAQLARIEAERIKHDASYFGLGNIDLEGVAHRIADDIEARGEK